MAAFNPKRLTNPNVVRTIEPGRLLDFLRPYQDYLCDRGLSLPSPRHATHLDLDRLVELLLTPSEKTPQDLLNAVYYVDELSTPQGMDALLAAARRAGMPFDESQDHSPADVAVQVWLFDPTIVEDQHAWQAWKIPRKMECFRSATAAYESLLELTEERISRAEDDCGDWLFSKNRSRNTKIFVRHLGNQIHFSLRRGDPFRRELAITADGVEHLHFRPAITSWNTGACTALTETFRDAAAFNQAIGGWNTAAVTSMVSTFRGATAFNQPLNSWNVSSVTSMVSMFNGATSFNQDLNLWSPSSCTNMSYMFYNCSAFQGTINGWNVSGVTNMEYMLYGCTNWFFRTIEDWNVSNVTNLTGFLGGGAGMDSSSYGETLYKWSQLTLQNSVTFDAGSSQYDALYNTYRQKIIDDFSWTINDGGQV